MRVYQFRHIRAPRILAATAGSGMLQSNHPSDRRHTHREPRFHTPRCLGLCSPPPLPAAPPGTRRRRQRSRAARSSSRSRLLLSRVARARAGSAARAAIAASRRASPPRSTRRSRRRRSAGGTGSWSTARPSSSRTARSAACGRSPACGKSTPARPTRSAARRRGGREGGRDLADRAPQSGRRDQDRDHRRRRRPDASLLRPGRLHDARRLPEGPDRATRRRR